MNRNKAQWLIVMTPILTWLLVTPASGQHSQASKYLGGNQRAGYTDAVAPTMPQLQWTFC